ncbi:MAG: hypothetical protein WAK35_10840 [Xanthobacteraceae bacterium]
MVFTARHPISVDVEDTVYACRRCGAEQIRTGMRRSTRPDTDKTSEAA